MAEEPDIAKEREEKLAELQQRGKEREAQRKAESLGIPYLDLDPVPIDRDNILLISRPEAERAGVAVIRRQKNNLRLGLLDPKNQEAKQIVERLKAQGFKIESYLISLPSFKKVLGEYDKLPTPSKKAAIAGEVLIENIAEIQKEIKTFANLKERLGSFGSGDTSKLLEIILASSLSINASDVHVEPEDENIKLRFRLDGILEPTGSVSKEVYRLLLSRIKLLGGIQLNVTDVPQDGRFTIKTGEAEVEVRVSILPGAYGEYIVLRILNPKAVRLEVKDLGIRQEIWEKVKAEIEKPNGIILVTGPTGSGKTTTLYAFLKYLRKPGIKIVTLEDPIEYHLEGISQSQIEPEHDYTFSEGLRSVLRQDPDIILVGEIRDEETAQTALNAALTGHFVFSTLHTNDAAGTIPRFLDLNAKPKILASALNAIIAQRLVRKLCPKCKKQIAFPEDLKPKIKEILKKNKDPVVKKELVMFRAVGCPQCSQTGYKGRIGVFEVMVIDKVMEDLIGASPSKNEVLELAKKSGFLTMYQDGLLRVLEGITTIEEVERVALATE